MATVNFARFSNIEALQRIHPDLLLELLKPYKPYFKSRGCSGLDRRRKSLDYAAMSEVLLAPDNDVPMDLVEGLWLTSEMGTRRGMDAILPALGDRRPPTGSRLTPLDVAVWAYIMDRDLLDTLYAEICVRRRRAFSYCRAHRGLEIPDSLPADFVSKLEEALDEYDESRNRGRHCRVSVFNYLAQTWFTIRRGDAYRREVDLEKKQVSLVFRPERYNTVILDRVTKELRINASTDDEVRMYESWMGELLCGSYDAFFDSAKFTLDPILRDGAACLATSGVPRLERVKLVEVHFRIRKQHKGTYITHNKIERSEDLFKTLTAKQWRPEGGELTQATFKVKFARSAPRTVTVMLPNSARFIRDSDCVGIEQWLEDRGFVLPLPTDPPPSLEKLMQMSLEQRMERNRFAGAGAQ